MIFYIAVLLILILNGCKNVTLHKELDFLSKEVAARIDYSPIWIQDRSLGLTEKVKSRKNDILLNSKNISRFDAIKIALNNNKEIQTKIQDFAAVKADFAQSNLFNNPYISYEYYQPLNSLEHKGFQMIMAFALSDYVHVPLKSRAMFKRLQQSAYDTLENIISVIQSIEKAYNSVIYYSKIHENRTGFLSKLNRIKDKVIFKSNKKIRSTLERSFIRFKKKQIESKIKLKVARLTFKRLLGLPDYKTVGIILINDFEVSEFKLPKTRDLLIKAYNYRPEIKALKKQIEYYEAIITLEKAYIIRNFNAGVDVFKFPTMDIRVNPLFSSLGLPIFDQNTAQIDKNKFFLEKSKQLLIELYKKIKEEVITQVLIFKGLDLQREHFKHAFLNKSQDIELRLKELRIIDSSEEKLQVIDEVLEERIFFEETTNSLTKYYYDVNNCIADLERALGTKLSSNILSPNIELCCRKIK